MKLTAVPSCRRDVLVEREREREPVPERAVREGERERGKVGERETVGERERSPQPETR
jgi:hypothetical protein